MTWLMDDPKRDGHYVTISGDHHMPRDTRLIDRPGGNVWHIKYRLPEKLWGQPSPKDGKAMGKTLRVSLETTDHREAIARRDILLGKLREMEHELRGSERWSRERAIELGRMMQTEGWLARSPDDQQTDSDFSLDLIREDAEEMEKARGEEQAVRWFMIASGQGTPMEVVAERYIAYRKRDLKIASINDLKTETKRFKEWAEGQPEGAIFQSVTRAMAYRYAVEYLPTLKARGGRLGLSWQSIKKTISCQKGMWEWAIRSGLLPEDTRNPWERLPLPKDRQSKAPAIQLNRDSSEVGIFTPDQWSALCRAKETGSPLGDTMRVALATGCRLSEITNRVTAEVMDDASGFILPDAKTPSGVRFVPLHEGTLAHEIIDRRIALPEDELFPDLPYRPSAGSRGVNLSQAFTRLRRDVLGEATEGQLKFHALRATWRTIAGRSGADIAALDQLGGWKPVGSVGSTVYDRGRTREMLREESAKVIERYREEGYEM